MLSWYTIPQNARQTSTLSQQTCFLILLLTFRFSSSFSFSWIPLCLRSRTRPYHYGHLQKLISGKSFNFPRLILQSIVWQKMTRSLEKEMFISGVVDWTFPSEHTSHVRQFNLILLPQGLIHTPQTYCRFLGNFAWAIPRKVIFLFVVLKPEDINAFSKKYSLQKSVKFNIVLQAGVWAQRMLISNQFAMDHFHPPSFSHDDSSSITHWH